MPYAADPRAPRTHAIAESSSDIEAFDGNVFHELLESLAQPIAVAALYRKFVGNAAIFICELRDQNEAARIDTLHTLKGSAAMMGARRLADLAMHLQTQSQGSSVQVAQSIQALERELIEFRLAAAEQLLELGISLDAPG